MCPRVLKEEVQNGLFERTRLVVGLLGSQGEGESQRPVLAMYTEQEVLDSLLLSPRSRAQHFDPFKERAEPVLGMCDCGLGFDVT